MKKKTVSPLYSKISAKKFLLIGLISIIISIGFTMIVSAGQVANVDITSDGIYATSLTPGTSFMMLRVVGPNGQVIFDQSTSDNSLQWILSGGLSDGQYSYEIRIGTSAKKQRRDDEGVQQTAPGVRPMVQSGHLLIQNGAIMPPSDNETSFLKDISSVAKIAFAKLMDFLIPPVFADVVHLDDVIIDGSECVGNDCVNGESFGFDTIRLKENNLRINFYDTSSISNYPTNDWRILINDSNDGGASYFSIEDSNEGTRPFTVEAGAPNNALYVDDYGRVGIGTAIPAVEIHSVDSDTPTLRLQQDGTGGWTPQTWDIAGNESNFFIRDATNASRLPFRIKPGAPTNSLCIQDQGNVGIGTWAPVEKLHVEGNALISGNLELGSSREYKNNIQTLKKKEAIDALKALRPVRFNYKNDPAEESVGFIAEEVPDLVSTNSRKSLSTMDVVAVLTKVIQEQQKAIEELSRKVDDLEKE
jgi:hypothetical protein